MIENKNGTVTIKGADLVAVLIAGAIVAALLVGELLLEAWLVMLVAGGLSTATDVPAIGYGASILVVVALRLVATLLFGRRK